MIFVVICVIIKRILLNNFFNSLFLFPFKIGLIGHDRKKLCAFNFTEQEYNKMHQLNNEEIIFSDIAKKN